jgi:hypothetical protein
MSVAMERKRAEWVWPSGPGVGQAVVGPPGKKNGRHEVTSPVGSSVPSVWCSSDTNVLRDDFLVCSKQNTTDVAIYVLATSWGESVTLKLPGQKGPRKSTVSIGTFGPISQRPCLWNQSTDFAARSEV